MEKNSILLRNNMNTKIVMSSSAILLGVSGIALSFFPKEIMHYTYPDSPAAFSLFFQILGALYFAFAMLNWTAKENFIGGIYGRPIAIGNLTHFIVAGLALIKGISAGYSTSLIIIITIAYAIYAIFFSLIFFTHPTTKE